MIGAVVVLVLVCVGFLVVLPWLVKVVRASGLLFERYVDWVERRGDPS